jgi:hypothetical protein
MWIFIYVLLFDLCWVEVVVGNSKCISMCKDFLGVKLAYCVCVFLILQPYFQIQTDGTSPVAN